MSHKEPAQPAILTELEALYHYIEQYIAAAKKKEPFDGILPTLAGDKSSANLQYLCQVLKLPVLAQYILLLCLAQEIDSRFATVCATAQANTNLTYPTTMLAINLFSKHGAVLKAITQLRFWQLIKVGKENDGQFYSSLRLTEWALHYIVGQGELDQWLTTFLQPLKIEKPHFNSEEMLAQRIVAHWSNAQQPTIIQLIGDDKASHQQIASLVAAHYKTPIYQFNLMSLPNHRYDLDSYKRLLEREILIQQGVYLINCDYLHSELPTNVYHITYMLECLLRNIPQSCILSASQPLQQLDVPLHPLYVPKFESAERLSLWQHALTECKLQIASDKLVQWSEQFKLSRQQIMDVVYSLDTTGELENKIHQRCQQQMRKPIAGIARWIEPKAKWQDLVLPDKDLSILKEMVEQFTHSHRVYQEWGFAAKSQRNLALAALFYGASGTGKTLAAEVLASELQLDLLQVDLSKAINKYVGETEKNLDQIFQAAEESGALLLFDEADALFGKRLQVNDSKDRYANIATSYLLQRIEAFQGLTILTTNFKQALDDAYMRRFRFVLEFAPPNVMQRKSLWQQAFPNKVPTQGLDYDKLSELNLTGGQISLIALNAAFKAAVHDKPVDMAMVLALADQEQTKLGVPAAVLQLNQALTNTI
jgi:hypothetical protein